MKSSHPASPSLRLDIAGPKIPQRPRSFTEFGQTREDPYFWLREKSDAEVMPVLKAENAYLAEVLKPVAELQAELYEEMKARLEPMERAVPELDGPYAYSWRLPEGAQYKVYWRAPRAALGDLLELPGEEKVILDLNAEASGREYLSLGDLEISPDHHWMAYSLDIEGGEHHRLAFRNLETGTDSPEVITDCSPGIAWASDSKTIFYIKLNSLDRPYQLWRHVVGQAPGKDALIYEEQDAKFFLGVERSRSGAFLIMSLQSKVTSEAWFVRADSPTNEWKVVAPRRHGIEYAVEGRDDSFLILTNDEERNFRLVEAPASAPGHESWRELRRGSKELYLETVSAFRNHWVIEEREGGLSKLTVVDAKSGQSHAIEFEEPVYSLGLAGNPEYETQSLRFNYASPRTPACVYDYNVTTRARKLRKQTVVQGFNPDLYTTERIRVPSHDGTMVPVSLLYRKDLRQSGPQPTVLYGYGAYGITTPTSFSSTRLSLVDRGFIYALGHVRGSGDLGRPWYEDGKFLTKANTFKDFQACAEGLIAQGYSSAGDISIIGGSAGGLLVTATMNLKPELYRAVVGLVPFVDVINTMLDETLPLTPIEFDEWGNPKDPIYYEAMKAYSPYDNLTPRKYPHVLLTAGLNDPRVTYWEPTKFIARLREVKQGDSAALLHINLGAGHGGASGRFESLKEVALFSAFIIGAPKRT